ncbi:ATP-binding cassette domain-containing protein [Paracoccus sp. S-4012]|uniref:ABC transporter ATP-binding protein n=1 Tax=Paracoccus sp. S-4012 TaxID=2665648 RepID=UPI0012B0442F|nr:ABC transporter ATP-binding protein [Paracoccus sp. S-4012]MRX51468.1 ATP-binding cassette domain-containing protein [Paracoccus sp. S-4012]
MQSDEFVGAGGVLSLSGVSRSFSGLRAVDNVSFEVEAGRITGLIGPNGAGKTTLFNTVCGELVPDTGDIRLDGQPVAGLPPHSIFAAGLARTFQIARPFARLSVRDNVILAAKNQPGERFWNNWVRRGAVAATERRLRDEADAIIEFCNLARVADQPAGAISGGQQKLVELARALMSRPRIVLLDEPGAGVNPALLEIITDRIAELNRRGMTFLIIEHNMDFITALADRLVVMAAGRKIAEGPPAEIMARDDVIDAYLGGEAA